MRQDNKPFDAGANSIEEEVRRGADRARVKEILNFLGSSPFDADAKKIARVRKLLEEDGYPAPSIIESIACHLAQHWPSDSSPNVR